MHRFEYIFECFEKVIYEDKKTTNQSANHPNVSRSRRVKFPKWPLKLTIGCDEFVKHHRSSVLRSSVRLSRGVGLGCWEGWNLPPKKCQTTKLVTVPPPPETKMFAAEKMQLPKSIPKRNNRLPPIHFHHFQVRLVSFGEGKRCWILPVDFVIFFLVH